MIISLQPEIGLDQVVDGLFALALEQPDLKVFSLSCLPFDKHEDILIFSELRATLFDELIVDFFLFSIQVSQI